MKFNTKTRYGLRTMIELAMQEGKGVFQKEISERQEISFKYLDRIIASLKAAGLILKREGRMSGYKLSRDPGKISVYDIYRAFEHDLAIVDCMNGEGQCGREQYCASKAFWSGLNDMMAGYMESVSLKELARQQEELNEYKAPSMYYI